MLIASCAACFSTVACSSHRSGATAATGPCKAYSACAVLTASDVTAATGAKLDAGVENDVTASPSAGRAEQVMCTYAGKSSDPFVSLQIRCCPCGDNNPGAVVQANAGDTTTVTDVSGIGDSAFWVESSPDAGVPVVDLLIVYIGADLQVVVSVSIPLGQTFPFDPLAAAKQMAARAVSRL